MKHWRVLLGRRLCSSLAFSTTRSRDLLPASRSLSSPLSSASSLTTKAMAASSVSTSTNEDDRPTLKGVIFDMDGTLANSPSLDFDKMYSRCNVPRDQDILKAVESMSPSDAAASQRIIDEIEEEGRQDMTLIPGATQVATWLHHHSIPMALVTRNTDKTVNVMLEKLWNKATVAGFDIILSRDNTRNIPPKPHTASLEYIASQWSIDLPSQNLLMVGDNPKHDIGFGKSAGVSTALFDFHRIRSEDHNCEEDHPDLYVKEIYDLPALLWKYYDIRGPLGTNVPRGTLKYPTPVPSTKASQAAVAGDIAMLSTLTQEELTKPDGGNSSGNTPLIWAADAGQIDVIDFILQNIEDENALVDYVNARGYIGATAFCRACQRGYVDVIRRLLEIKTTKATVAEQKLAVNVNIPNDKMQYPLHFAAFKRHREVVSILLEHGADTLALDRKGRTPAEDTDDESIRDVILRERQKTLVM